MQAAAEEADEADREDFFDEADRKDFFDEAEREAKRI